MIAATETKPGTAGQSRSKLAAAVKRAKQAVRLARRDLEEAETEMKNLAKAADDAHDVVAQYTVNGEEPPFTVQAEFDEIEHRFSVQRAHIRDLRRLLDDAKADQQAAERALSEYVQNVELESAPERFDVVMTRAHAALTAIAAGALAASLSLPEGTAAAQQGRAVTGSIVAVVLGLFTYGPQILATVLDAWNANRSSATRSFAVDWHRAIQLFRATMAGVVFVATVVAWYFVLSNY